MTAALEYLLVALLVIAGTFGLIGSYGLWKLRDPMQRLHAPTKASTVGVGAALLASVLSVTLLHDGMSWHELLVVIFLFITAPITALFLAKLHIHATVARRDLPPTGVDRDWASFDERPEDDEPSLPRPADPR